MQHFEVYMGSGSCDHLCKPNRLTFSNYLPCPHQKPFLLKLWLTSYSSKGQWSRLCFKLPVAEIQCEVTSWKGVETTVFSLFTKFIYQDIQSFIFKIKVPHPCRVFFLECQHLISSYRRREHSWQYVVALRTKCCSLKHLFSDCPDPVFMGGMKVIKELEAAGHCLQVIRNTQSLGSFDIFLLACFV